MYHIFTVSRRKSTAVYHLVYEQLDVTSLTKLSSKLKFQFQVCRTIIFNFGYFESQVLILGIEIEVLGMSNLSRNFMYVEQLFNLHHLIKVTWFLAVVIVCMWIVKIVWSRVLPYFLSVGHINQ